MADVSPAPARRPLTAPMIRALGKVPPAARPELPALMTALAEAATRLLGEFTSAPMRVDPDGLAVEHLTLPLAESQSIRLLSDRGALAPLLVADRMLVMGLCEAAFGGTGTEPPFDGDDRPLSRTETRLRQALLQSLADRLPACLELCLGTAFQPPDDPGRKLPPAVAEETEFIAGRLLVHVYGYTGEIRLMLPEIEIAAILAGGPAGGSAGPVPGPHAAERFREALFEGPIALTVQLPQELMQLGEVARLRKGQLLKFKATAQTPLLVSAEGVSLHRARLSHSDDHVTLEIIDG
jgi:flagellar motor switch protein FliM